MATVVTKFNYMTTTKMVIKVISIFSYLCRLTRPFLYLRRNMQGVKASSFLTMHEEAVNALNVDRMNVRDGGSSHSCGTQCGMDKCIRWSQLRVCRRE